MECTKVHNRLSSRRNNNCCNCFFLLLHPTHTIGFELARKCHAIGFSVKTGGKSILEGYLFMINRNGVN